jgi:type I restriction enzyme M protein
LAEVVADGTFDLVLTNPPFGSSLTVPVEVGQREGLLSCRVWSDVAGSWKPGNKMEEQQLGIAFFERSLGLLKPGGRMAIVLPETFLFSRSCAWFIDWVCSGVTVTHVVDVPMVAFEEFCRAKTCLLVVTKTTPEHGHSIVFSYPRTIGQDRRGSPLLRLDERGERAGERDDEMGEAARQISARVDPGEESRLRFTVPQETVRWRGILVPRFWWRKDTEEALARWSAKHPSLVVRLGDLVERGVVSVSEGHGSPPGNARATGDVPYVKVTDLKNWRINENPTNFIHASLAAKLRKRGRELRYGDLVSPARASSNIGQFSLVLPWQTGVVLTREVVVLRVEENGEGITPFLLLALMSLKVVQEQYRFLTLMQTNREHLGDGWKEVQIPLPSLSEDRLRTEAPVRAYFEALVKARESYSALTALFDPQDFGTRP